MNWWKSQNFAFEIIIYGYNRSFEEMIPHLQNRHFGPSAISQTPIDITNKMAFSQWKCLKKGKNRVLAPFANLADGFIDIKKENG